MRARWVFPIVIAAAVTSCIIAEPPSDPPRLPLTRPTIVRGSVVPPSSAVIGRWPDKFIVPVELSDPTASFEWAVWFDFDPSDETGEGLQLFQTSTFAQANTQSRVRRLEISVPPPSDDRCHLIEVLVALRFVGQGGTGAHAPLDPGGDIVSWYYNPKGDISGCPVLDGGIQPLTPDGSSDAADGSIQ